MAVKVTATRICDRCKKSMGVEAIHPSEGKLPDLSPTKLKLVSMDHGVETVLAEFDDLCKRCDKSVKNIVARLVNDDDTAPKTETKSEEASTAPPVVAASAETAAEAKPAPVAASDNPEQPFGA